MPFGHLPTQFLHIPLALPDKGTGKGGYCVCVPVIVLGVSRMAWGSGYWVAAMVRREGCGSSNVGTLGIVSTMGEFHERLEVF